VNSEVILLKAERCPGHVHVIAASERGDGCVRRMVIPFNSKEYHSYSCGEAVEVDPQEPQIGEQCSSDQFPTLITLQICFQILTRSGVIMQWVHLRLRAV